MTGGVVAVVVTYNRADKLTTALDRLLAQDAHLARVVVVDNASTDSTADVLERYAEHPEVVVLRLPENVGGAGGFTAGMQKAYDLGAEDLWLLDDDCYPRPDALSALLRGRATAERLSDRRVPFACSLVLWRDGSLCHMGNAPTSWDWARLYVEEPSIVLVERCSFVSVLVPRWAVESYGLPLAEYFIWMDDVEYTRRLVLGAGSGIQVLDSRVEHDTAENQEANFKYVNERNLWKFRYGARNGVAFTLRKESRLHFLMFVWGALFQMHEGQVPYRLRLKVMSSLAQGLRFNPEAQQVAGPDGGQQAPPAAVAAGSPLDGVD